LGGKKPVRSVLILTLALVAIGAPARSDDEAPQCILPSASETTAPPRGAVVGHYAAVSESEWNLEVWLNADGSAEVLSEGWDAGHHDERTSVRHRGSWKLSGPFVELRYRGLCETLIFSPALSFAEFGKDGAAPGLQGRHSSVSQNLFIGRSLWRVDSLRAISEVK
jgi:hypothetical protein